MRRISTILLGLIISLSLGWGTAAATNGGSGNDELYGTPGSDYLVGGPGADILMGKGGADILRGGPGWDTCYVSPNDVLFSCEDVRQHR
jgi:Ca2+-binding RTX toxin-like protein